tara:strand:+ start:823 stop:1128 length:306 start_codon:yes stop_codon:yes gene_type:complete
MSVEEANKELVANKNFKIIDVRESWEHDIGKINNCIELPLSKITEGLLDLEKSTKYGVICHSGVRSLQACYFLKSKGYTVLNISGGIEEWSLKIDNEVPRY